MALRLYFYSRMWSILHRGHKLYLRILGKCIFVIGFGGIHLYPFLLAVLGFLPCSCHSVLGTVCRGVQASHKAWCCIRCRIGFRVWRVFAASFDVTVFGSGNATCTVTYLASYTRYPMRISNVSSAYSAVHATRRNKFGRKFVINH